MSERTKLLKKAVLTGVGATTNGERVKEALKEAMDDLVKIGQELLDEMESKGKGKAKEAREFLSNLQDEAKRRSGSVTSNVSSSVHRSVKKAVAEWGLATKAELEALTERVNALEHSCDDTCKEHKSSSKRSAK
jgi:polyhydroxyalkanoate synthesis regulator phasin